MFVAHIDLLGQKRLSAVDCWDQITQTWMYF